MAFLEDLFRGHVPWAVVLEFQIEPDALMFGRMLGYFSPLWLELKPNDERGDRFQLGAIIVNLTGKGSASRAMDWAETGMYTELRFVERNLGAKHADVELASIAAGTSPPVVLSLIPLMQGGGEPATITKWLELASAEPDARRRSDYGGLALVFAEAAGCLDAWKDALKEWNVIQSKQVNEWQDQARTQMAAELLLRFLKWKFGELPEVVEKSIQSLGNTDRLSDMLLRAGQCSSFDEWRQGSPEIFNGTPH